MALPRDLKELAAFHGASRREPRSAGLPRPARLLENGANSSCEPDRGHVNFLIVHLEGPCPGRCVKVVANGDCSAA
jgi:hypothetical protein